MDMFIRRLTLKVYNHKHFIVPYYNDWSSTTMNINDSIKTHRSTYEIMKILAIEHATTFKAI